MSVCSTDPLADMLTRIRNGLLVQKEVVVVPYSQIKSKVAQILVDKHFLVGCQVNGQGTQKELELQLQTALKPAKITGIWRVSKPGRRVYSNYQSIPKIKHGRGLVILSTSQGLLTGDQAYKSKVGGEVLCAVY